MVCLFDLSTAKFEPIRAELRVRPEMPTVPPAARMRARPGGDLPSATFLGLGFNGNGKYHLSSVCKR